MSPSPQEFLEALRSAVQGRGGAEWLAARVEGDAILVLFRQDTINRTDVTSGPVQGTLLHFGKFAQTLGPAPHRLEEVLAEAVLEIVEPHEPGARLMVSWADGLCADPRAVLWRPEAIAATAATRP